MRKLSVALALLAVWRPASGAPVFLDRFDRPDGLVCDDRVDSSADWKVTSGELFVRGQAAWTDSPVFRVVTKRAFGDAAVSVDVFNVGLRRSAQTPAKAWDGVHIFLRYRSPFSLYYATIQRRDNKVVIKKKRPGGGSNGGAYFELSDYVRYEVPYGSWHRYEAMVEDRPDGSVQISVYADGRLMVRAVDDGRVGGAPLRGPGRSGLRADNADFKFANFAVFESAGRDSRGAQAE